MDVDQTKAWRDSREQKLSDVALKALSVSTGNFSDVTNYLPTRGISFHTAGVIVATIDDTEVTIPSGSLAAGIIHAICLTQIKAGTAADGVMLYW